MLKMSNEVPVKQAAVSRMALSFLRVVGSALIQASGKVSDILLTCRW